MVELVARGLEAQQDLVLIFRTLVAEEGCGKVKGGRAGRRRDVHVRRRRGGGPTPPAAVAGWLGLRTQWPFR